MEQKRNISRYYFFVCDIKNKKNQDLEGPFYRIGPIDNKKGSKIGFGLCGGGSKYTFLMTKARTPEKAKEIIDKFIHGQKEVNISILPIPADFQILRSTIYNIRGSIKAAHNINALFYIGKEELNIKALKPELNRLIQQNDKWTREYKELYEKINLYIRKPNRKLKLEILSDMFELNIRPDGIPT